MKKCILFILCALLYATQMYAQKQVTTFLGIPVDGSKDTMVAKLKTKGFRQVNSDYLQGVFNGEEVLLSIGVNGNKVRRIAVFGRPCNEQQIKVRFNHLIHQFKNSEKYKVVFAELLSEKENISYEITVNNKAYGASFYQLPEDSDLEYRNVWIQIFQERGDYFIGFFYDNKLNEAQGEDL